jgi:hypothetical protein
MKPEAGITPENVKDIEKAKVLQAKRHELFDKEALADADARITTVTKPKESGTTNSHTVTKQPEADDKEVSKPAADP